MSNIPVTNHPVRLPHPYSHGAVPIGRNEGSKWLFEGEELDGGAFWYLVTPHSCVPTAFSLSLLNQTIWRAVVLLHTGVEVISHLPPSLQSALQMTNSINLHSLPVFPRRTVQRRPRTSPTEGVRVLWHGVSSVIMGAGPAHAVRFGTYEAVKELTGGSREGNANQWLSARKFSVCSWLSF